MITACGDKETGDDSVDDTAVPSLDFQTTYADIAHASYEDSLTTVQEMNAALAAFVASPGESTLDAAKDAWLAAREPYGQTEGFRFAEGPIDDEDGPEGDINSWPMDEAAIDYVEGDADAGFINDLSLEITKDNLRAWNQADSEEGVTIGYHAVEFLLWGQDLNDSGPGQRPYTDYTTADNADRRGETLLLVGEILEEDLRTMVDEWDPAGSGNYRAEWLEMDRNAALALAFQGIITLSIDELPIERMQVAVESGNQEDEHSCFSDNTHRDVILNNASVINLYKGSYTRVDGTTVSGDSLSDLVAQEDAERDAYVRELMDASVAAAAAMPVPFDQALTTDEGKAAIGEAATAIYTQAEDGLIPAAALFGITFTP